MTKDPIGFSGLDFNLYRYVDNNPVLLVDPKGLESYLASRDFAREGSPVSHNFIVVTNEKFTKVISFGPTDYFKLRNVGGSSANATDLSSLASTDTKYVKIEASDSVVLQAAERVSQGLEFNDVNYSPISLNSNSAAQAVAEIAQGGAVSTPSSSFAAPGSANSQTIIKACGQ